MSVKAVEWDVIDRMPGAIRLLPIPKPSAGFYDFDDYVRLVAAAKANDRNAYLVVLLGGEAGLRCGEIMALEWGDVDLSKRQLCVQRSDWKGHVTATKGGRLRYVPMTVRLAAALREHRHLRGARVLCQRDGSPLTQKIVRDHVHRAAGRAQRAQSGDCIDCGTPSVRTWPCAARRRGRFGPGGAHGSVDHAALHARASPAANRRSDRDSWIRPPPRTGLEIFWRRQTVRTVTACRRRS